MNGSSEFSSLKYKEGLFSAISAGFFFVLIGAIFVTTPNLFDQILTFFRDFDLVSVPNTAIHLPAPTYPPTSPSANSAVYSAVTKFSFIWGLFEVVILVLRFFARSPLSKKAETTSNLIFWLGTSYLTSIFLNETTTTTTWFVLWTAIIMLIGVSLIVRAIILATAR